MATYQHPSPGPPSWFPQLTHAQRAGIYYNGQTIGVTLDRTGATSYVVVDGITGVQVASGSITGATVTVGTAGTAPFDKYGFWKVEITGPNTDAYYGTSYNAFTFCYIPTDARFPTNSNTYHDTSYPDFTGYDCATRGIFCIGPERWKLSDASNPTSGDNIAAITTAAADEQTWYAANGFTDSARPRPTLVAIPGNTFDCVNTGSFRFYCKNGTLNGANIYVAVSAGSTSGTKIQVYYPNSTTLVETYDNLASTSAAQTAINGVSNYILVYGTTFTNQAVTAIGNAFYNGVKQTVSSLYPTITYFEGPSNEPSASGAELATQMMLFSAAVKAGNASAKVLGPCLVTFDTTRQTQTISQFFAAGGGNYIDGFSTHGYNCNNLGDLHLARREFQGLMSVLTAYGQQNKPRWQTECLVFYDTYGVRHGRRAVTWQAVMLLMLEQYGFPKEATHFWYDVMSGYWGEPAMWRTGNGSLAPHAVMYRTFSAEVFGKAYSSALSFGSVGDDIYLGNVYTATGGASTIALLCASVMSNGQAVLNLSGSVPATVTLVDTWGNTSTLTVINGQVTVPLTDGMPHYLRLPAGVTATVATWGAFRTLADSTQPSVISLFTGANSRTGYTVSGSLANIWSVHDDNRHNAYDLTAANPTVYVDTTGSLPGYIQLDLPNAVSLDHLVIFCPPPWSTRSAMTAFTVQTSPDGTNWTTQYSYTNSTTGNVTQHAEDTNGWGTTFDSYWDEQHIWDITFPRVNGVKHLKIAVTAASYGGEPNANCTNGLGQGGTPQLCVAGISGFCDDNQHTTFVVTH